MNLIFDTETTGLPNPNKPPDDPTQPWPIQLAWVVEDATGRIVEAHSTLIDWSHVKADVVIHPDAEKAHGISQSMIYNYGNHPDDVMREFESSLGLCSKIIAHNLPFDMQVLQRAWRARKRNYLFKSIDDSQQVCTMQRATPLCRIPTAGGSKRYKPPNLAEAYRYFFKADLAGAHDALTDVYACRAVWHGIQRAEGN